MTVAQNIELVPDILGWDKAQRKVRVGEQLELVSLLPAQYQNRYPHEFSGSEQQCIGMMQQERQLQVATPQDIQNHPADGYVRSLFSATQTNDSGFRYRHD